MYSLTLEETDSTLISDINYDELTEELEIVFKRYYVDRYIYIEVPLRYFIAFSKSKSFGKFYLSMIKPNFLLKPKIEIMADKIIKIKVNVQNVKKDWLFQGEKGTYLNMTLFFNEEKDAYENNGMLTQDVPKDIYEKEKKLSKDKKTNGPILGNARVFERVASDLESAPGKEGGKMGAADDDDLPF